jgi:hypothetical protein
MKKFWIIIALLSFYLSMISGQTLCVCPEGKPVPTPACAGASFFRIMR